MLFSNKKSCGFTGFFLFQNNSNCWPGAFYVLGLFPIKHFYFAKLLIGYTNNPDLSKFGKKRFDPLYMHFGILATGAMANVNGKLEHRETILCKFFLKFA